MGIRFQCPNGHKLNVKADLAGKRASCPECGVKLVIPTPSVTAAAPISGCWYMRTAAGEQLGPTTDEEFGKLIAAGHVTAGAHIWREGWSEWKLACDAADALPMPLAAVPIFAAPIAPPPVVAPPELPPVVSEPIFPEPVTPLPLSDLDLAAEKTLISEPIVTDSSALAASDYVFQRRRTKRKQLTLTIIMLVTVIVLACVLVWVLRNNVSSTPQTWRTDSPKSSITSAANS